MPDLSSPCFPRPHISIHADTALMVYLAAEPSAQVLAVQQLMIATLRQIFGAALRELVPSYNSLLLVFDLQQLDHQQLAVCVEQHWTNWCQQAQASTGRQPLVQLPCYYSAESGADLPALASAKGLSVAEVITLHSQQDYLVYAIGFAPGFAYLGFVDPLLQSPRHSAPRLQVPAGSVALADRQTAVYPAPSPGGWQLLGRCPLRLFALDQQPVMPFAVGDRVRFEPVDRAEYLRLGGEL